MSAVSQLLRRAACATRRAPARHPLIFNVTTYAAMCGVAEASQQLLEAALGIRRRKEEGEEGKGKRSSSSPQDASSSPSFSSWSGVLDSGAIARMTVIGGLVMAPALHGWYRLLDGWYPGRSWPTVAKKLLLDCTVASLPLYSAFYVGTSLLEGRRNVFKEWRQKFLTTYVLAMAFWIPVQTFNFAVVPPASRVVFIAACTFVELNGLCLLKRYHPE